MPQRQMSWSRFCELLGIPESISRTQFQASTRCRAFLGECLTNDLLVDVPFRMNGIQPIPPAVPEAVRTIRFEPLADNYGRDLVMNRVLLPADIPANATFTRYFLVDQYLYGVTADLQIVRLGMPDYVPLGISAYNTMPSDQEIVGLRLNNINVIRQGNPPPIGTIPIEPIGVAPPPVLPPNPPNPAAPPPPPPPPRSLPPPSQINMPGAPLNSWERWLQQNGWQQQLPFQIRQYTINAVADGTVNYYDIPINLRIAMQLPVPISGGQGTPPPSVRIPADQPTNPGIVPPAGSGPGINVGGIVTHIPSAITPIDLPPGAGDMGPPLGYGILNPRVNPPWNTYPPGYRWVRFLVSYGYSLNDILIVFDRPLLYSQLQASIANGRMLPSDIPVAISNWARTTIEPPSNTGFDPLADMRFNQPFLENPINNPTMDLLYGPIGNSAYTQFPTWSDFWRARFRYGLVGPVPLIRTFPPPGIGPYPRTPRLPPPPPMGFNPPRSPSLPPLPRPGPLILPPGTPPGLVEPGPNVIILPPGSIMPPSSYVPPIPGVPLPPVGYNPPSPPAPIALPPPTTPPPSPTGGPLVISPPAVGGGGAISPPISPPGGAIVPIGWQSGPPPTNIPPGWSIVTNPNGQWRWTPITNIRPPAGGGGLVRITPPAGGGGGPQVIRFPQQLPGPTTGGNPPPAQPGPGGRFMGRVQGFLGLPFVVYTAQLVNRRYPGIIDIGSQIDSLAYDTYRDWGVFNWRTVPLLLDDTPGPVVLFFLQRNQEEALRVASYNIPYLRTLSGSQLTQALLPFGINTQDFINVNVLDVIGRADTTIISGTNMTRCRTFVEQSLLPPARDNDVFIYMLVENGRTTAQQVDALIVLLTEVTSYDDAVCLQMRTAATTSPEWFANSLISPPTPQRQMVQAWVIAHPACLNQILALLQNGTPFQQQQRQRILNWLGATVGNNLLGFVPPITTLIGGGIGFITQPGPLGAPAIFPSPGPGGVLTLPTLTQDQLHPEWAYYQSIISNQPPINRQIFLTNSRATNLATAAVVSNSNPGLGQQLINLINLLQPQINALPGVPVTLGTPACSCPTANPVAVAVINNQTPPGTGFVNAVIPPNPVVSSGGGGGGGGLTPPPGNTCAGAASTTLPISGTYSIGTNTYHWWSFPVTPMQTYHIQITKNSGQLGSGILYTGSCAMLTNQCSVGGPFYGRASFTAFTSGTCYVEVVGDTMTAGNYTIDVGTGA